jgi:hypothetical protein
MTSPQRNRQPFNAAVTSLVNAMKAANKAVPGLVVLGSLTASGLVAAISLSAPLMVASAALLVVLISVLVYAATSNYGEAALALVAGLLTVLTVQWEPWSFTLFSLSWVGFSLVALMIASVRLAAKTESLYRQAALAIVAEGDHEPAEKALRAIGERTPMGMLGPVERAEVLRIFALRQLPIEVMEVTLKATETLATATTVDAKAVAVFFADVYHAIGRRANTQFLPTVDFIYATIKASPAPPEEFFEAFRECRHLLLSGSVDLAALLKGIRDAIEVGVPASEVDSYISTRHGSESA